MLEKSVTLPAMILQRVDVLLISAQKESFARGNHFVTGSILFYDAAAGAALLTPVLNRPSSQRSDLPSSLVH
jgi:hypothetical protein